MKMMASMMKIRRRIVARGLGRSASTMGTKMLAITMSRTRDFAMGLSAHPLGIFATKALLDDSRQIPASSGTRIAAA